MKMLMRTDKNKKWDVVESNSCKAETAQPMLSDERRFLINLENLTKEQKVELLDI